MPTKPRFKTCVLAILVAAMPLFAEAAGLGRLNVLSGLGQPFKGEIDLLAVQPNEVETLKANLGSVDAYASAQLAYPTSALGLRLALEKRNSGQYYVLVTSSGVLDEPVFNLLVDLSWSGGKIRRGYTALIDPVGYSNKSSAAAATPTPAPASNGLTQTPPPVAAADTTPKASVTNAIKAPKSTRTPKASKAEKAAAPTVAASAPVALSGDSYTVKAGDTLSSIAGQVKPEGVSLEQVLVGLYRANTEAFDGNMNRLKRGKILRLPAAGDLDGITKAEAAKEIRIQAGNWQNYRRQLAESAGKAPAVDTGEQASGGRITAKVEDKGAKAADKGKDVLKLSRGASKTAEASARMRALEEEAAARKKALEEANQRVAQLQSNVKKMEDLAALKSKSGAALQQKAEQTSAPVVATPEPVVASPVASQPAVVASAPQVVASTASTVEPVKPKRVAPPPPPVEEPGIFDTISENIVPIGGGIAAILLGIGGFIWSRNRRKPSVFENSLITSGDLKPNTVLGRTGGGVISTQAENSFLTDFSRQGLGTIDTDEVDPIAEADVYMAYGRNAQAEEILKDALAKDPHRQEIRMKLLDIFAARKDKTAFEEVAADIFSATGGSGSNWDQTVHMGLVIDPNNPLYVGKSSAAAQAPQAPAAEELFAPAKESAPVVSSQAIETLAPVVAEKESLDFEFDLPGDSNEQNFQVEAPVAAPALQPVSDDVLLDLDAEFPADEVLTSEVNEASDLMELDLPIDLGKEVHTPSPSFAASEMDIPDLDLDLGLDAMPDLESAEEAQAVADFNAQLAATELPDLSLPDEMKSESAIVIDEPIDLDFTFKDVQAPAKADDLLSADMPIDIDLEMSGNAGSDLDFASDDPVQTKIDLARAYIDMGDVEGAREILQEAEQEGSPAQQVQARTLLSGL